MKLVHSLYEFIKTLTDLIYPDLCIICYDNLSGSEDILCVSCKSQLPVIETGLTDILLRDKLVDIDPKVIMSYLLYRKGSISQKLLYLYKYEGRKNIGNVLGRWFAHHIREHHDTDDIDIVVPVPLHPKKMKKRGFNQSEVVAGQIANVIQKPCLTGVLSRRRSSTTQTKKSRSQRMTNVSSIFESKNDSRLTGKHVLLVDDVITTGATLSACSEVLKRSGVKAVSIATLTAAK